MDILNLYFEEVICNMISLHLKRDITGKGLSFIVYFCYLALCSPNNNFKIELLVGFFIVIFEYRFNTGFNFQSPFVLE